MSFSKSIFSTPVALVVLALSLFIQSCGDNTSSEEYTARANKYFSEGDNNGAVIEAKNALRVNSNYVDARWLLGKIYLESKLGADAEKELRHAISLGVTPESALEPLAGALLLQFKHQEALDLLETKESHISKKSSSNYWVLLGDAYSGLKQPNKAQDSYQQAIELDATKAPAYFGMARLALQGGHLDDAKTWNQKALTANSKYAPSWSFSGDLARQEGDAEQAEVAYSKAIENSQWNPADLLNRAFVRISLEKYKLATSDLNTIREKIEGHSGTEYAYGLIQFLTQNHEQAKTHFQASLLSNPRNLPAIYYLGVTHHLLGQQEQAYNQLNLYVKQNPNNTNAQLLLASIEIELKNYVSAKNRLIATFKNKEVSTTALKLMSTIAVAEGNIPKAIEYLQIIAENNPDEADTQVKLGLTLMVEGDTQPGTIALKKALELNPNAKMAEFALIFYQKNEGHIDAALASALSFTQRYPKSPMAWNTLGMLYMETGKTEEAKKSFEESLNAVPGEPGASHNLAVIALNKENDTKKAMAFYEKALATRPGHINSLKHLAILKKQSGQLSEIKPQLLKGMELNPTALEPRLFLAELYLQNGNAAQATNVLLEVNNTYKNNLVFLDKLSQAQLQEGDLRGAIVNLKNWARINPRSTRAIQRLADAYIKSGETENLDKTLNKALALQPNHLPFLILKLQLLMLNNELASAEKLLHQLQQNHPESAIIYRQEAALAGLKKQPKNVVISLEKAHAIEQSTESVGRLALAKLRSGKPNDAIKTLEDWVATHPNDNVALYNLANIYILLNQTEKATLALEKIVEANPNNIRALTKLAKLLINTSTDKAAEYAQRAYKLAPENPQVLSIFGQAILKQGDTTKSIRLLERAAKKSPNNLNIKFQWIAALAKTGSENEALTKLKELLALDKRFSEEKKAQQLLTQLTTGN